MSKVKAPLFIGDKTAEQWDSQRVKIPNWLDPEAYNYRGQVGVILFRQNGTVVAISIGTELKGGLQKRTADFYRDSPSGRNYQTGYRIYAERHTLDVEVIITGSDVIAQKLARRLKYAMIKLKKPAWHPKPAPKRKKSEHGGTSFKVPRGIKTVSAAEVVVAQPT